MNVVELIFAFWLGRATKGANPLVVVASFFLALILVALVIGVCVAVWHYSPEAAHVVESSGVGRYLPFLDLHIHDVSPNDLGGVMMELPSRLVICAIALFVISVALMAAIVALNFATAGIVRSVRFAIARTGG
ncbi:hypothetical protein ACT2FY_00440 [Paraburkholderia fungorum]|uniref:hypothetical protein n=1 Tax=Paraburkholderia fungorum TaxID=134537 RepID=UPI00402BAD71